MGESRNAVIALYRARIEQHAREDEAGPRQALMGWALDELETLCATLADPRSPDARYELERLMDEVRERFEAPAPTLLAVAAVAAPEP